ncbi:MAG TPA: hypothetical protein VK469_13860, partial [Candidatus Kapabacteria bacterium]|nr:hypothetical protein [Candidatus Kapabacteria bacterium]
GGWQIPEIFSFSNFLLPLQKKVTKKKSPKNPTSTFLFLMPQVQRANKKAEVRSFAFGELALVKLRGRFQFEIRSVLGFTTALVLRRFP